MNTRCLTASVSRGIVTAEARETGFTTPRRGTTGFDWFTPPVDSLTLTTYQAMNHRELVRAKISWLDKKIDELEAKLVPMTELSLEEMNSTERSIQKLDYARNLLVEIELQANREA